MKTIRYSLGLALVLFATCHKAWSDITDWYNVGCKNIIAECLADNNKMERLIRDIEYAEELTPLQSLLNSLHLIVSTAADKAHHEKAYQDRDRLQRLYVVISAKQLVVDPTNDTAYLLSQNREFLDRVRAHASAPDSFEEAIKLYAPYITPAEYVLPVH